MSDRDLSSIEHLQRARDMVGDALQMVEDAQVVLFRAGDHYVAQVWGDGVRRILALTERLTEASGELSGVHIEIGRLMRTDGDRSQPPPEQG